MDAGGDIQGHGITIFYTGTDLTINGHADTALSAPNSPGDPPVNGAVEDLLLYVPDDISAVIKINGTSGNTFGGTMYAPASGWRITGTSNSENPTIMNTSIIGKAVWVSGTSYINIKYDDTMDAGWPAFIQVQK